MSGSPTDPWAPMSRSMLRRLHSTAPAIVWAGLIWVLSTGSFSSAHTTRIFLPIAQWLVPYAHEDTLLVLHEAIRKSAHVAEYFILSWLVMRAVRNGRTEWTLPWALAALAITLAYAGLDELHQNWALERAASVRDVLLDAFGAVLAQIALWQMRPRR